MAHTDRAVVNGRTFDPGDIVTETTRLTEGQRKVYLVLGPSRKPGKIRVCTWSHASKDWSQPYAALADIYSPAPEDWPQTKAVKKYLANRGESSLQFARRLNQGDR
jgi:hypothetical protein